MILWTIQQTPAYDSLKRRGILYGSWNRILEPTFKESYIWLIDQMKSRGIPIKHPPVWAWVKKPDLRRSAHLEAGKQGVRLRLDTPDSLVLLSEFCAWHCVLNNIYLPTSLDDKEEASIDEIRESWKHIFPESETCIKGIVCSDGPHYQATLPYLKESWVTDVTYFTAR